MPAVPPHSTPVTDRPWDGPAAVAAAPGDAQVLRYMHAWRDPDGDPATKAAWKLPHHAPGTDTAANLAGARNALSRLPQTDLPDADRAGVERHLRGHLEDAQRSDRRGAADVERRYTKVAVETRASEQDKRTIGGYAARFNHLSKNLGGFVEQVDPGAFNMSRGDGWRDVLARYNHDDNMLLGSTNGATLRLRVDDFGLDYEVDLPAARSDIYELVARGDIGKSSFAFRTIEDDWSVSDQNFPMRTLLKVDLVDVAPVNTPAYADTSAAIRSLAAHLGVEVDEVQRLAEADELRRFFVRTDDRGRPRPQPKPTTLGAKARMELLGRATDPYM